MRFILALLLAVAVAPCARADDEIRVIAPGVISNSGLDDIVAAFEKQTKIKVTVQVAGMGEIMARIMSGTPAADVVMLPMDLMAQLSLAHGTGRFGYLADTGFAPLGRVEIGLFKKPDAPAPDISTVEKLAAAMKTASAVLYTDPASGSMQARMSGQLLARPEFSIVKGLPIKGDAEPALKRGDGDANAMGLGLIHGRHDSGNVPTDNPYLVGMLPPQLGMHMDMATAISARSQSAMAAALFISFALSPDMLPLWKSKGVDRY
jgi:hypothetical protein